MATKPPKRTAASSKFSYAPRAPAPPRIQGLGASWGGLGAALSRGLQTKPAAAPSPGYNPTAATSSSVSMAAQQAISQPDIRDPAYWLNLENISNYYGTQKAQYGEQSRQDLAARDRALLLLGQSSPTDALSADKLYGAGGEQKQGTYYSDVANARTAANKAGLFYSGQLGQNLGNILSAATQKSGDITSEYQNRENMRNINLNQLGLEYGPGGTKERAALQDAADRAAQAAKDEEDRRAYLASLAPPSVAQAGGNQASTYGGSAVASPFTSGHLQGPRGEPLFTRNGKYYYKRASDGKVIPWGG